MYIVSAVRTAVGKAKRGSLAHIRPEAMGAAVVKEAVQRVPNLDPKDIDDVLIGCAFPEGSQGMNVGRIIAQKAGLPDEVPGATFNRFCASGLQSIASAAQAIQSGQADIIVAGGCESMSAVPMGGFFYSPDAEMMAQMPDTYIDMGNTAENVAAKYGITRQMQDAFAVSSNEKALSAIQNHVFADEIVALDVAEKVFENGKVVQKSKVFAQDEGARASTVEGLGKLATVFRINGTVTAGNASQMSDGAAAVVVMSEAEVQKRGIKPLGKMLGFAVAGVPAGLMGMGPVPAIQKVLQQTGLSLEDIDLFELNEAFAAQALACVKELGINPEKVNVNGGAIALGHPLGCTGAKLTTTLLYEMQRRNAKYGIVSMCIGGGMGAAGVFERV
jgi:acetyl-CoA acyltransferase